MFQFLSHAQICLLLVLVSCVLAQVTVIDPRAADATFKVHYHCLYSNKPIQIKDPFDPSEKEGRKFITMDWYKTKGDQEETLVILTRSNMKVLHPAVSIFEHWGIQINNISMDTDGNYTAKLIRLSTNLQVSVLVAIAVPPVLTTLPLQFNSVKKDGSMTASCGPIISLGDPAVNILFTDDSGKVLNMSNKLNRGFVQVTYTDGPAVDVCDVDATSPSAKCILDKTKWHAENLKKSGGARADNNHKSVGAHLMMFLWTKLLVLVSAGVQVYC